MPLLGSLDGPLTPHCSHARRSRHRIRPLRCVCQECRIVVCAQYSAARAAMGHWGNYLHIPGMAVHCLVTLGGHTHTTMTTFGAPVTVHVFDGSNCGSGVVRWCAHHLQHIGSPWGIGGNTVTPKGWQDTAWSPWWTPLTPPWTPSTLPTLYSMVP